MTMGLFLKFLNALHFKKYRDIFFEFIPEVLFLMSLFGYLVVVIFIKWFTDFVALNRQAPSLITMLINLFLSAGSIDPEDQLYPGQAQVQLALLFTLFVCVPWLLLPKPLLELRDHKRAQKYLELEGDNEHQSLVEEGEGGAHGGHGHGEVRGRWDMREGIGDRGWGCVCCDETLAIF